MSLSRRYRTAGLDTLRQPWRSRGYLAKATAKPYGGSVPRTMWTIWRHARGG